MTLYMYSLTWRGRGEGYGCGTELWLLGLVLLFIIVDSYCYGCYDNQHCHADSDCNDVACVWEIMLINWLARA